MVSYPVACYIISGLIHPVYEHLMPSVLGMSEKFKKSEIASTDSTVEAFLIQEMSEADSYGAFR